MSHLVGRALLVPRSRFYGALDEADVEPANGSSYAATVTVFQDGRKRKPFVFRLEETGEEHAASRADINLWLVPLNGAQIALPPETPGYALAPRFEPLPPCLAAL